MNPFPDKLHQNVRRARRKAFIDRWTVPFLTFMLGFLLAWILLNLIDTEVALHVLKKRWDID